MRKVGYRMALDQLKIVSSLVALMSLCLNAQEPHDQPFITMVTLSTPNRKIFANLVETNQKKYARLHGYGYHKYRKSLDTSRPEEWSKVLALLKQMRQSSSEWLLWIDDDIVITNPEKMLENFVKKYGHKKNLIIARDAWYKKGVPINNGIFLIRNVPWSKRFLRQVWSQGAKRGYLVRGRSLLEQQMMTDLMNEVPAYAKKIAVIDQCEMNSFLRSQARYDDPEESRWKPGDFAAHVTGMSVEERYTIIKNLIEQGDFPTINPLPVGF